MDKQWIKNEDGALAKIIAGSDVLFGSVSKHTKGFARSHQNIVEILCGPVNCRTRVSHFNKDSSVQRSRQLSS